MIGKILADRWSWTEKLGGTKNATVKITTEVAKEELDKLKQVIQDCNTTAQVDVVIKKHGLSDIEGLPEHIKELYEKGEIGKLKTGDINGFIQTQNYQNIADAAHGYSGVKQAIDAYNESLQTNTDGTVTATANTEELVTAIGSANSSLGKYLTGLNGTTAELGNYVGSLVTATLKTFALQAATMALNAAVSFGVSFAINGIISLIQYLASADKRYLESQQNIIDKSDELIQKNEDEITSLKELQTALKEAGTNKQKLAEISQDLNKSIGDTKGLLNGESEAWDKANLKLKDRIELLDKQNQKALDDKIQAQENIYSNAKISNSGGVDVTLDKVRNKAVLLTSANIYGKDSYYRQKLLSYLSQQGVYDETFDEIKDYLYSGKTTTVGQLFDYINEKAPELDSATLYELITRCSQYGYFIDADEFQEYFNSQTQLSQELLEDFVASSTGAFDETSLNNMIADFVESGFSLTEIKDAIDEIANNQELENAIDSFYDSLLDPEADSEAAAEEVHAILDGLSESYPQLESFFNDYYWSLFNDIKEKDESIGNSLTSALADSISDITDESSLETLSDFKNELESLGDTYSKVLEGNYSSGELIDMLYDLKEAGIDISNIDLTNLENIGNIIEESLTDKVESLISTLNVEPESGLADYLRNVAAEAVKVTSAIEGVTTALDNIQGGYDTVTKAIEEYNTNGYLTIDTLNDILSLEPEYLSVLRDENGQLSINKDAYIQLAKAQIENAKQAVVDEAMVKFNQLAYENLATSTDKAAESENIFINLINTSLGKLKNYNLKLYSVISAKLGLSKANIVSNVASQYAEAIANNQNLTDEQKEQLNNSYKEAFEVNEEAAEEIFSDMNTKLSFISDFERNIGNALESDSSSSSSSSSSTTAQTFDWIETALSRTDEALSRLDQKISDTYSSWTERNKSLAQSMEKTKEAISLQEQAYSSYIKEADAIGLSDTYKRLVQNGTLRIEDITDSSLADKISEYQDLYAKAISCLDTAQELKQTLNEISTSDKWNNIKTESDAVITSFDSDINSLQTKIDQLELKGLFADSAYYADMASLTQKKISTLTSEASQLQSILNTMTSGTEAYDTMFSELMDIRQEIAELENDCIEFNNTIRSLDWEIFEYLEEAINRITDETEYLTGLLENKDMYDDDGSLTKYADAAIALHAAAYDTYRQQAQDYYDEVQDLQRQLINGAGQEVLEQYNEMAEAHRDAVNAAEDEKEAILDLIENGYDAQLDAIQELIDRKKEALSAEKDLYSYQKSISEQTANISSLEKQKLAYENDTSEEAMSKIQQIKVELEEAKADLQETEYEQYLSDTEDMLDQLAEAYENWMNDRLDNSDALLAEIVSAVAGKGDQINATLNEVAEEYGTFISDTITSVFDSASPFTNALTNGLNTVSTTIAGTTAAIDKLVSYVAGLTNAGAGKTNAGSGTAGSSSSGTSSSTKTAGSGNSGSTKTSIASGSLQLSAKTNSSSNNSSNSSNPSWGSWFIKKTDTYPKDKLNKDTSIVDRLKYNNLDSSFSARAQYYSAMGGSGTYTGSAAQNIWMLSQMKSHGYRSGTSNAPGGYHWTQEDGTEFILRKSDGAILTPLGKGDMVFTSEMSRRLWEMAQGNFAPGISIPDFTSSLDNIPLPANSSGNGDVNFGDININMELSNVHDYTDFRKALVQDGTFKNALWNELSGLPIKKNGVTNWSALSSNNGVPTSVKNK